MTLSRQTIMIIIIIAMGMLTFATYTLNTLRTTLIENKKEEIQTILTFAVKQASFYIQQEEDGLISHSDAKKKVINQLNNMRSGDSFVWANDNSGIAQVHPNDAVLGTFQHSYARYIEHLDNSPFYFTLGESKKPSKGDRLFLKVNGITKLPNWDWMLGIGFYLGDINNVFHGIIGRSILLGLFIMLVVLLLIWFIRKSVIKLTIGGEPQEASNILEKIYMGNFSHEIPKASPHTLFNNLSKVQTQFKRTFLNIEKSNSGLMASIKKINNNLEKIEKKSIFQKEKDLHETIKEARNEIHKSIPLIQKISYETKSIK